MSLKKSLKIYEVFITTPEDVTDVNKKVWFYLREKFRHMGVTVGVLAASIDYKVQKDRNLFWVKISLTEDQLDEVKVMSDVVHIFCKGRVIK